MREQDTAGLVNPFIGTDNSRQHTVWESNGGTYPGAAYPFGMVQVTPENYKYGALSITGFSFLEHHSGYPNGSRGRLLVTPFYPDSGNAPTNIGYTFSHQNESASPGYYSVLLEPDQISAEMTVSAHAGYGRFTFLREATVGLIFSDLGKVTFAGEHRLAGQRGAYYYTACFNVAGRYKQLDNRVIYEFEQGTKSVDLKIGFSTTSLAAAQRNLDEEVPEWDFKRIAAQARDTWNRQLQSIRITGGSKEQRIVFYTALYHSLLDPHRVSDAGDSVFYSELSPWDTFHCKQPLIILLQPERQRDMIRSLLRSARQNGRFPVEDMEGLHNIPIVVDSYLKGITDFNVEQAYQSMRACLLEPPYGRPDIADFLRSSYCPDHISYSVSKTLDYAYDFWALSQMALALNKMDDYRILQQPAGYYRNHFNSCTQLMTARAAAGGWSRGGYREGTAWTYTWCVPHDVQGLMYLFGGAEPFSAKLDSCFAKGYYVHDNEPPLHYPYLFNQAGQPWKTQYWVRSILDKYYANDPGGLNGNDDLGALSAWYVFSAMGFFPVCPGSPYYELSSPVFEKTVLALGQNKTLTILAHGAEQGMRFIRSVTWNGTPLKRTLIRHSEISQGGVLEFTLAHEQDTSWAATPQEKAPSLTTGEPVFHFSVPALSHACVNADEPVSVSCAIANAGTAVGAARFAVQVDGQEFDEKWVMVEPGATKRDTIWFKLYQAGDHEIVVADSAPLKVNVRPVPGCIRCLDFTLPSPAIVKVNEETAITVHLKNVGSESTQTSIPLLVDQVVVAHQMAQLAPGEEKNIQFRYQAQSGGSKQIQLAGLAPQTLHVYDAGARPKSNSYDTKFAPLLVYSFDEGPGAIIQDQSGNANHGRVVGAVQWHQGLIGQCIKTNASQNSYVEIPATQRLSEIAGSATLSVLAWIYPMDEKNFSDIISQGDWNVLQLRASNTELNYYSGSWSRGEVYALVPDNWNRHWHHLAGVTDGVQQKLYIDGHLQSTKKIAAKNQSAVPAPIGSYGALWNLGRNADVPDRVFNGYLDEVRIYRTALTESQIRRVMMLSE